MKIMTRQEMQWMDKTAILQYGIPSIVLMENAGRSVAKFIFKRFQKSSKVVVIICGRGNNGGDGLVIARQLLEAGWPVKIFILSRPEEFSGDALVNLNRLSVEPEWLLNERSLRAFNFELKNSALIIDAIFGTGLDRPVTGLTAKIIQAMNHSKRPILAVDIPSGLCANTGKKMGEVVHAEITCTFHLPKQGLLLGPDVGAVGELQVFPIGIPKSLEGRIKRKLFLITSDLFSPWIKEREKNTHKNRYGHVLTIAGSKRKIGAALMAARSALRVGAGLSSLALPECAYEKIDPKFSEIMFEPLRDEGENFSWEAISQIIALLKNKKSISCGPGMGVTPSLIKLVGELILNTHVPLVLDADALNCLAKNKSILRKKKASIVLTPHPGEMAHLTGLSTQIILQDRVEILQQFCKQYEVYCVLKGYRSLVGTPKGEIYVNPTGNPGMATAGTGDVLTGIISGLIAQGLPFEKAILAGIWIHGRAGDRVASKRGEAGMLAWDIAEQVPEVLREILLEKKYDDSY